MARILFTYGIACFDKAMLAPHEVLIPPSGVAYAREELLALLPSCDAVLACTAFDRELIAAGRRLKLIVCYGAGYDAIDVSAATELGIPVCNLPDSVTEATAELTLALMLSLARRIPELDGRIRRGENAFGMGKHMGISLVGRTLGVIGMGRIGSRVAEWAAHLGMQIVYSAHAPKPSAPGRWTPLDELLRTADIITLHCPCTAETEGLLSRERLALLKPMALLVNTARGRIVDQDALCDALLEGRIAGAALDVYQNEPNVPERLRQLSNVVLTPHVGSNTLEARTLMARAACEHLRAALEGRRPEDLLNPQLWRA